MEHKSSNPQIFRNSLSRILVFIGLSIFFSCKVQSQSFSTSDKKAIKYFEKAEAFYKQHNYSQAKIEIANALERDENFTEVLTLKAYIALDEADYNTAKESFNKAISNGSKQIPGNLFFLAELELKDGEYESAKKHFEQFLATNPTVDRQLNRSKDGLANIDFALNSIANPIEFEPKNLGPEINSQFAEYFPCLTVDEGTILYTRRLPNPDSPAGFNEDFFISEKKGDKWTNSRNLGKPINTLMNEGAPSLSADGQLLIFTACELYGDYGEGRNGAGSCDLFYTSRRGSNWSKPINLGQAINSRNWETQPSFSADGRTLYFVRGKRDRSGNRTGDIYTSKLNEDNYWSAPVKLNRNINTLGNEESVFIHPDGKTLYFASDGHLGMGGLDIFIARKDENGDWGKPVNLGYPINTHKNENSLLIDASGELAYFASDRAEGFGELDLYSFVLPNKFRPESVTYFSGKIYDKESTKPLGTRFELIDLATGELVVESFSDPTDGSFLVSLPKGKDYALNASKEGYLFFSENFSLSQNSSEEPFKKDVPLNPIKVGEKIILKNIFFETAKFNLKEASKIELDKLVSFLKKNQSISVEVSGHTDNVGSDITNKSLSLNRANSVASYLNKNGIDASRVLTKGFGSEFPIADNTSEAGRAQNRRTEFKIIGM